MGEDRYGTNTASGGTDDPASNLKTKSGQPGLSAHPVKGVKFPTDYFKPVVAIPWMKYLCPARNIMAIGMEIINEAAIKR